MNVHNHLHRGHVRQHKQAADAEPSTIVSVIYVTASPTFTGAIGGYTTLGVAIDTDTPAAADSATSNVAASANPVATTTAAPLVADTTQSPTKASTKPSTKASTTLKTSITAISSPATTVASSVAILAATPSTSQSITSTSIGTASAATATPSSTTSSGGMSGAGKAGLSIGILLLLGAVLSLVLYCFKRRRDAAKGEKMEDEKHEFANINRQQSTTSVTAAKAPRLSLRPVTQFLPYGGEKRKSRGNDLLVAHPTPMSEKRPVSAQSNNRQNPFGNHAETIDNANVEGPIVVESVGPAGEIVTRAASPAGLKRGASKSGPKGLDFTNAGPFQGPPSPAGTEFSLNTESAGQNSPQTAMGNAIAAAGGPTNTAVHRVQLDFNPSMADELELRAGQLIRLLHEYDDGWAMCIRLDRSQQGVVPRTCLSTRPVKPRPQQNGPRGPPPGMRVPQQQQQQRGPGPQGQQGPPRAMAPQGDPRPMTPQGQGQPRPMTPQGQAPRPMTPQGQGRIMTPQGTQQDRARAGSSASQQPRFNSPAAPSPMNTSQNQVPFPASTSPPPTVPLPADPPAVSRKPVPGQAL